MKWIDVKQIESPIGMVCHDQMSIDPTGCSWRVQHIAIIRGLKDKKRAGGAGGGNQCSTCWRSFKWGGWGRAGRKGKGQRAQPLHALLNSLCLKSSRDWRRSSPERQKLSWRKHFIWKSRKNSVSRDFYLGFVKIPNKNRKRLKRELLGIRSLIAG